MRITIASLIVALLAVAPARARADKAALQPGDEWGGERSTKRDQAWSATASQYRGRIGLQVEVICPSGGRAFTVWGNNPYTDDSSICTAAVHAGLLGLRSGGHVLIEIGPGRKAFTGNQRKGVTSASYGAWEGSFVFPQAALDLPGLPEPPPDPAATTWSTSASRLRGRVGQRFEFICPPGGSPGSVWGNGPYTDDSSICTAAVHAKVTSLAEGGRVWIEIRPGAAEYPACARNGIGTRRWGAYPGAFSVLGGTGTCTDAVERVDGKPIIDWSFTAASLPGKPGTVRSVYCPPGGVPGPVYGSGLYTDDSSICTAAVHAGVIAAKDGGGVIIQIRAGQPDYQASFRHGVQSAAWRDWSRSFQVLAPER